MKGRFCPLVNSSQGDVIMLRKAIPAVLVVALAVTGQARENCTLITLKDDYKRASIVLLGEALTNDAGGARFRVIRAWKGNPGSVIVFDDAEYQRRFQAGQTVLVFAYERGGVPYLHDCSHTNPVTAAFVEQEIRTLNSRSRWWNCPISSMSMRRRPGAP